MPAETDTRRGAVVTSAFTIRIQARALGDPTRYVVYSHVAGLVERTGARDV